MNAHMCKQKGATEHWLHLLFSDCMIWESENIQNLRFSFQNMAGDNPRIIHVERLYAGRGKKKKNPLFPKPVIPFVFTYFPSF